LREVPDAKNAIRDFPQSKMEMRMRMKLITALVVPLIAALTAQAAAASEHHHRQAKGRAVPYEQFLNSNNAYGGSVEWPEPYKDTYQGPVYDSEYMAPTANGG
jgi:hypothetical protein